MTRRWVLIAFAAALLAAACSDTDTTTTLPGGPGFAQEYAEVEDHLFLMTLGVFQPNWHSSVYRAALPWHDWTSDGCSKVPDSGFVFDFAHPCHRHDWGYRNFKVLGKVYPADYTWNEVDRLRVDDGFLADMTGTCLPKTGPVEAACKAMAVTYYWGVRALGK